MDITIADPGRDFDSNVLNLLPCEIRVKIYSFVPYQDLLTLRQVSSQIKEEIDENLAFHISIDQSYKSFRRLTNRRVRSMIVTNLNRVYKTKQTFLRYPDRLRRLAFDGKVSKTNIHRLLMESNKLESVDFTHETLRFKNLFMSAKIQSCFQNNMMNLTELNLQFLRYPIGDPFIEESNITSFLNATFPSLKSFKLYYSLYGNWKLVFLFIQRHVNTLKNLELQVGDRGDVSNTQTYLRRFPHRRLLEEIDCKMLCNLKLTSFKFRDDVLHLNQTVQQIIIKIIKAQKNLQTFHFHSQNNFTIELLEELTKSNHESLTDISIYNLRNTTLDPVEAIILQQLNYHQSLNLDMKCLEKCSKLKSLALACSSAATSNVNNNSINNNPIKMLHLQNLPLSLEKITLAGFVVRLEEIVRLSKNLQSLNEFVFTDGGPMKYSSLLQNFLKNCPKLKFISVQPIIARCPNEASWFREVNMLSKLYKHFMGIKYDPIDDLEGFEAELKTSDHEWIENNI